MGDPVVIQKGERGQIQVALTEFKGTKYIDVRNYYLSEDEFKPTPKGLMIPTDYAVAVANAILAQHNLYKNPKESVFYVYVDSAKAPNKLKAFQVPEDQIFEDLEVLKHNVRSKAGYLAYAIRGKPTIEKGKYVFAAGFKRKTIGSI